jgi:nuclease S1
MKSVRCPAWSLLLLLLAPLSAFGWSAQGHWVIGDLASRQLTPHAREQVALLLEGEADPTLAGVSTWADELRASNPENYRRTGPWHYINSKDGTCHFVPARDCPDGSCAPAAIEAQMKILADAQQPREQRRDALKFVVHFVGDIHQPLHADPRDDAGGNRYQVTVHADVAPPDYAAKHADAPVNLHTIWDYYVLASRHLSNEAYASALAGSLPHIAADKIGTPWDWAAESCSTVDSHAIYPPDHIIDNAYLDRQRPLAEQRLTLAAVRLAYLLNRALDPGAPAADGRPAGT